MDALQQIIDNCDAGDIGMDQCPGLIGGVNNGGSCTIPSAIDETVFGVLDALPGDNPITSYGAVVVEGAAPAASVVADSSATPSPTAESSTAASSPTTSDPVKAVDPPATSEAASTAADVTAAPGTTTVSHTVGTTVVYTTEYVTVLPNEASSSAEDVVTIYTTSYTTVYPPSATEDASLGGWTYVGCQSDKMESRVLSGVTFADLGASNTTTSGCIAYCEKKGYSMAGTEWSSQCFCGDELTGSSALPESSCNMPCIGDASETCGGGLALSVYKNPSASRRRSRHVHEHLGKHAHHA